MPLVTEPNAAIPPYRRKAMDLDPNIEPKGHAAGVLYVAPDGDVLLLRRSSAEENFAGHWALPGGGVDEGETPEQGAARESREEMGFDVEGGFKLLERTQTPTGKVFHTFAKPVADKFVPKLNEEHTGYAWAPLDMLPGPIHPAVQSMLKTRVGVGEDMKPEDWKGLRDGFVKWTQEEETEGEHVEDSLCATDHVLHLAMDRDTIREKSPDGHLHVRLTPISKATVNPYRGKEIPNAEELGLDPNQIYHLLRDPEELAKSAPTFNGKPYLRKHEPTSAKHHAPDKVIGSTMNDCVFEHPYLKASLAIWPQEDIDDIESEVKKENSAGYRYRADMTPGIFDGMRYDGVMRDIVGNHVALVKDGRAGPDVVVGDSMENLMIKSTRLGAYALLTLASAVSPMLAMDAKLELPKDGFAALTTKNIGTKKTELLASVRKGLDGKLRKGMALDASMSELGKVMDNVAGLFGEKEGADATATPEQETAMAAPVAGSAGQAEYVADAEPLKAFLKEKGMDEASIQKACDLMPKSLVGKDEDPEEKKKRDEAEKAAADAAEALKAKDEEMKNMVTKPAMDEAIQSAVKAARKVEQDINSARSFVRDYVGELTMAFDSADDVYREAAKAMGIDGAATIHASALPTLIKLQPKAGAQPLAPAPIAMDAASTKDFNSRFPGAERISSVR